MQKMKIQYEVQEGYNAFFKYHRVGERIIFATELEARKYLEDKGMTDKDGIRLHQWNEHYFSIVRREGECCTFSIAFYSPN